jgi:hypothetical protein
MLANAVYYLETRKLVEQSKVRAKRSVIGPRQCKVWWPKYAAISVSILDECIGHADFRFTRLSGSHEFIWRENEVLQAPRRQVLRLAQTEPSETKGNCFRLSCPLDRLSHHNRKQRQFQLRNHLPIWRNSSHKSNFIDFEHETLCFWTIRRGAINRR